MERLEPTRTLALKVWWAFTWRTLVAAVSAGLLAGFLIATIVMALGVKDPSALRGVIPILCVPLAAWLSTEVMYRILKKKFKGFEIALVRTE